MADECGTQPPLWPVRAQRPSPDENSGGSWRCRARSSGLLPARNGTGDPVQGCRDREFDPRHIGGRLAHARRRPQGRGACRGAGKQHGDLRGEVWRIAEGVDPQLCGGAAGSLLQRIGEGSAGRPAVSPARGFPPRWRFRLADPADDYDNRQSAVRDHPGAGEGVLAGQQGSIPNNMLCRRARSRPEWQYCRGNILRGLGDEFVLDLAGRGLGPAGVGHRENQPEDFPCLRNDGSLIKEHKFPHRDHRKDSCMTGNRRKFLQRTGASVGLLAVTGGGALAAAGAAKSPNGKSLAGVFPIGWTPCKPDNSFDADAMVKQQQFLNRGKVAGMAWPQNASGWQSLTQAEWHAGAEALASVKGDTALVLGVQTTGFNTAASQAYAQKAKSLNADGIISLVPPDASETDVAAYFKALSDASGLPIMVQAVGNVSVDNLVAVSYTHL